MAKYESFNEHELKDYVNTERIGALEALARTVSLDMNSREFAAKLTKIESAPPRYSIAQTSMAVGAACGAFAFFLTASRSFTRFREITRVFPRLSTEVQVVLLERPLHFHGAEEYYDEDATANAIHVIGNIGTGSGSLDLGRRRKCGGHAE